MIDTDIMNLNYDTVRYEVIIKQRVHKNLIYKLPTHESFTLRQMKR